MVADAGPDAVLQLMMLAQMSYNGSGCWTRRSAAVDDAGTDAVLVARMVDQTPCWLQWQCSLVSLLGYTTRYLLNQMR